MGIFSSIAAGGISSLLGGIFGGDQQEGEQEPKQQSLIGRGINAIGDSAVNAAGNFADRAFDDPAARAKQQKQFADKRFPGTNAWEQLGSPAAAAQTGGAINQVAQKRQQANERTLQQEQLTLEREKIAASIEVAKISAGATTTAAATPYDNPTAKRWGDTFAELRGAQTATERDHRENVQAQHLLIQAQTGVENDRRAYIDAQTDIEKAKLPPAMLEQRIAISIMQSPGAVKELGQARITKQYASSVTAVMINAAMHQFGDTRGQAAVKVAAALAAAGLIHTVGGILGRFPIRGGRGNPHQQQGHQFPKASGRPYTPSSRSSAPRQTKPSIAVPKPQQQHGPNPTGAIRRNIKPGNPALNRTLKRAGF